LRFDFHKQIIKRCSVNLRCEEKKLSVVTLTWTQKYTNLSAESIIFFNVKRYTVKVGFFDGKISVDPLCNASTDFNASTLQRTLCPALMVSDINKCLQEASTKFRAKIYNFFGTLIRHP
jgi:hypothetical protein